MGGANVVFVRWLRACRRRRCWRVDARPGRPGRPPGRPPFGQARASGWKQVSPVSGRALLSPLLTALLAGWVPFAQTAGDGHRGRRGSACGSQRRRRRHHLTPAGRACEAREEDGTCPITVIVAGAVLGARGSRAGVAGPCGHLKLHVDGTSCGSPNNASASSTFAALRALPHLERFAYALLRAARRRRRLARGGTARDRAGAATRRGRRRRRRLKSQLSATAAPSPAESQPAARAGGSPEGPPCARARRRLAREGRRPRPAPAGGRLRGRRDL